jgi:CDP-paratose 2-epimerase
MDDLSRKGSDENLVKLKQSNFKFIQRSVCQELSFFDLPDVDAIFHLAAQVGVQKSIDDPKLDMRSNILGTFNVLEYARGHDIRPYVVFASTNKVYGNLQTDELVNESTPLNFHTPYGVSKGAAEQYVLEYDRTYGVPGIVFRQSCIYGPHQLGTEEQGWVAWFLIANKKRHPITIFGNGEQVRDALYVDDLVRLYDMAWQRGLHGQAYNIGGGKGNQLSLHSLIKSMNIDVPIKYTDWRSGDQKHYVSDISKIKKDLGWFPAVPLDAGLSELKRWVMEEYDG